MIRIHLTDAEARRLEQASLQATDRKFRDRLPIVRLAHRGRPHQDIAADLGITPRTVQRWLNADLDGGIQHCRFTNCRTTQLTWGLRESLHFGLLRWFTNRHGRNGV